MSYLLTDQVSNLDSSEPKSDVLPVTPSVRGSLGKGDPCLRRCEINKISNVQGLPAR